MTKKEIMKRFKNVKTEHALPSHISQGFEPNVYFYLADTNQDMSISWEEFLKFESAKAMPNQG